MYTVYNHTDNCVVGNLNLSNLQQENRDYLFTLKKGK